MKSKHTFMLLVILLLVLPVNAIPYCQCQNVRDTHPYCVSFGNTMACNPDARIVFTEKYIIADIIIPDGSKEYPIKWDVDNPTSYGKGWYYYVSPSRPFYLPYNYPTIVSKT